MIINEKNLRLKIRKMLSEGSFGEVGVGGVGTSTSIFGDKNKIDINNLPAMTGKTSTFVFQSIPCNKAASVAKSEGNIWDSKRMGEKDEEAYPYLKKYWDSVGWSEDRWTPDTHWSAAFVSWVMQHEDGNFGSKWKSGANHRVDYLADAVKNRQDVEANPDNFKDKVMYVAFSGEEIIGNGKESSSKQGGYPGVGLGEISGKDMLQPGDVIGKIKSDGGIHMDVFVGGDKKVGGNTNGGYSGSYNKTGGTSGLQPAKTNETTDVIKRVKILGSIESFVAANQDQSGFVDSNLPLGQKLSPSKFKSVYGPIMKDAVKGTPLFASVKLAQMALETGWGRSTISGANNLFGIKGKSYHSKNQYWDGSIQDANTEEVYDGKRGTYRLGFRKYKSPYDSIMDHNRLLLQAPRYQPVRDAKTPEDQARALKAAGYATGLKYAEKLIQIINDYGFKEFDEPRSGGGTFV